MLKLLEKPKPSFLFLYLVLFSISILFFILIIVFLFRPSLSFDTPTSFFYSTIILMVSSLSILSLKKWYKAEQEAKLIQQIVSLLILAIAFILVQIRGWQDILVQINEYQQNSSAWGMLLLLSFVHALHVMAGIFYWLYTLFIIRTKSKDIVQRLIYFSDSYEPIRLDIGATYWHFMGILWLLLMGVFIIKGAN